MSIPFFYHPDELPTETFVILNEETSKHVVQVLRMKPGEQIKLTDGKGNMFMSEIVYAYKKSTEVKIISTEHIKRTGRAAAIGISLIKNSSRFEWFLEKATELGIHEIIPLICSRTEKQHFRLDRLRNILVSAMLQSQQAWLPEIAEPLAFHTFLKQSTHTIKMIAHCIDEKKVSITNALNTGDAAVILIGPEGDFTSTEIAEALSSAFTPITLGETRLRTETAGIAAAVLLRLT